MRIGRRRTHRVTDMRTGFAHSHLCCTGDREDAQAAALSAWILDKLMGEDIADAMDAVRK